MGSHRIVALVALAFICAGLLGCSRGSSQAWQTTDISGHLPDLQFSLANADHPHLTPADLRGKIVLLYFGYTHCPDVCPMTLSRLAGILRELGTDAANVRVLFVSVDPARDTPQSVTEYAHAFSPLAIGAVGTPAETERLARRYRVAYQAEKPNAQGGYEVMHGKGVYVFDREGRARLLLNDTTPVPAVLHDLKQLVDVP